MWYDICGSFRESKASILIRTTIKSVAVYKFVSHLLPSRRLAMRTTCTSPCLQQQSHLRTAPPCDSPRMPVSGATTVQHTKNTSTTNEEPIKNISMQQCDNKSRTVLQRGVQQVVRKVQHTFYLARTDSDVTPSNRSPLQGLVDRTTSIALALLSCA